MGIQLPIMDGYKVTRQINRVAIDFNNRHHLPRAGWGRTDRASSRM
jgi:hypothetical protein